jgi:hypothetical protein
VINRIKAAVLVLFALYWVTVILIWLAARPVFDQVGGLRRGQLMAEILFVVVLTTLLGFLSVAVVRGWRWIFWLILIAFLAGILRVPAAVLELTGRQDPAAGPRLVCRADGRGRLDSIRRRPGDVGRLPQVGTLGRLRSKVLRP